MKLYPGFVLLLCCLCPLKAATFNVNVLTDGVDVNPGDGICEMTAALGDCSLRAATNEANALGGSHIINLAAGIYTLTLVGEESTGLAGDLNIYGAAVSITGQGATNTIIDGNDLGTVMDVGSNDLFSLQGLTITGGLADSATEFAGGGLVISGTTTVANLQSVAIIDNVANAGAGLYVVNADVTITESLFQGNDTQAFGYTNLFGPAILTNGGTLTIDSSTFTENDNGSKAIEVGNGEIYMTNTTVSQNQGGGLRTSNTSGVVRASTFYNTTAQNLSHYSFDDTHVLNVGSSVLTTGSLQPTNNCQFGDLPVSLGHNVVNDTSCAFTATGDLQNATDIIDVLADNGGLWPTHLPGIDSQAINAVPPAHCVDAFTVILLTDQRGISRPFGVNCDSGSVEYNLDIIFKHGFE